MSTIRRPKGLPRMGPSQTTVVLPPPPPPTRGVSAVNDSDGDAPAEAPRRNKAAKTAAVPYDDRPAVAGKSGSTAAAGGAEAGGWGPITATDKPAPSKNAANATPTAAAPSSGSAPSGKAVCYDDRPAVPGSGKSAADGGVVGTSGKTIPNDDRPTAAGKTSGSAAAAGGADAGGWGPITATDKPAPSKNAANATPTAATPSSPSLVAKPIAVVTPVPTSAQAAETASRAAAAIEALPTKPPPPAGTASRYEKKYVCGSITIVGCEGLINHTTSNTMVHTNPYVEVFDNNPRVLNANVHASVENKINRAGSSRSAGAGAIVDGPNTIHTKNKKDDEGGGADGDGTAVVKPILMAPHMKNTIAPTFDFESSTINFRILTTGMLTVQARHHDINKTFRSNGFTSSSGVPNNKVRSVSSTRLKAAKLQHAGSTVSVDAFKDLDTFLGEVQLTGMQIAEWLMATRREGGEASSPSPIKRVNAETGEDEDDDAFTVHHAAPPPLQQQQSIRNKATPSSSFSRKKSVPSSSSAAPTHRTHTVTLPLAPRSKESNPEVKAASAKGAEGLGTVTLIFGPPVEGFDSELDAAPSDSKKGKGAAAGQMKGAAFIPDDAKVDGYMTLLGGTNLLKRDVGDDMKSDPYAIVYYPSLEDPIYRTDTAVCTLHPEWAVREALPLDWDNTEARLIIDVWNENPRPERDNFLGRATIKASELPRTDQPALSAPLAPREGERDSDIAKLAGRLGSLTLSWRVRRPNESRGATTLAAASKDTASASAPSTASSSALPRPPTTTRPNDSASIYAQQLQQPQSSSTVDHSLRRVRVPSAPVNAAAVSSSSRANGANSASVDKDGFPTKPLLADANTSSSAAPKNEDGLEVYTAPPLGGGNSSSNVGASVSRRSGRVAYATLSADDQADDAEWRGRSYETVAAEEGEQMRAPLPKQSNAMGGGGGLNDNFSSSHGASSAVAPLDPAAIQSLMSTLNSSSSQAIQAMLKAHAIEDPTKPAELPKHRSMFFTADDYLKYGLQPPMANGASPYALPSSSSAGGGRLKASASSAATATASPPHDRYYYNPIASYQQPSAYTTEAANAMGANGPYGCGAPSTLARPNTANRRIQCGHAGGGGGGGLCRECEMYGNTAMPPADQIHPPPPFGAVVGETFTTAPIVLTDIVPIKLRDDKGKETIVKMGIDDPHLKPILAAAERCFNIHPSSAMLLYNGEMINPLLSLRENGVLMLKGDGAIEITVRMFKGQRVNVVIKVKKGPPGCDSNPYTNDGIYHQQQEPFPLSPYQRPSPRNDVAPDTNSPYIYIPLAIDSEWTVRDLKHMFIAHRKCPSQYKRRALPTSTNMGGGEGEKNSSSGVNAFHFYWRYNRLVDNMTIDYYRIPNGTELVVQPKQSKVMAAIEGDCAAEMEEEALRLQQHDYHRFTDDRRGEHIAGGEGDDGCYYEEDTIGIPRHKTALELRRERRRGKGSVTDSGSSKNKNGGDSIRNRSKSANSKAGARPMSGAITTVTKKGGISAGGGYDDPYGSMLGRVGTSTRRAAATNPALVQAVVKAGGATQETAAKMMRGDVPIIEPLGAPEYAIGGEMQTAQQSMLPSSSYQAIFGERVAGSAHPTSARARVDSGLGTWGSATFSDSYANYERPEWDDRRSTGYEPNGRFTPRTHSGYGVTKTVLGGRATVTQRPPSAGTSSRPSSPYRPTSPHSGDRPSSPYAHRRLTEEERNQAMDIRPDDWRTTLRTDGRRNMHVPMPRDADDSYHRGRSAHGGFGSDGDEVTYSYAIRPLNPNDTSSFHKKDNTANKGRKALYGVDADVEDIADAQYDIENATTRDGRPLSPQQKAKVRARRGELVYGETLDQPLPIYGNDYTPLAVYDQYIREVKRGVVPPPPATAFNTTVTIPNDRPASPSHLAGRVGVGGPRVGGVDGGGYDPLGTTYPPLSSSVPIVRPPTVLLQRTDAYDYSDPTGAFAGRIGSDPTYRGALPFNNDKFYDGELWAARDRFEGMRDQYSAHGMNAPSGALGSGGPISAL